MVARFIGYIDETGGKKLKVNEEWLRIENEGKEKLKKIQEEEIEKVKRQNSYWLNKWLYDRRLKRQSEYIEYLRIIVPKERWDEDVIRRFVSYIDIRNEDDCWEWLGDIGNHGYGRIAIYGSKESTHRFIYMLVCGEIPKDKPNVLHKCNNRKCVNYNHLYAGTYQDNANDRNNAGRTSKGESRPLHKLQRDIPNKIREEYDNNKDVTHEELANKYGIACSNVSVILQNKGWKDYDYTPSHRSGLEGDKNGRAKRTWEEIDKIRKLWMTGEYSIEQLSVMFTIPQPTVRHIIRNETWSDDKYQKLIDDNKNKASFRHIRGRTYDKINNIRELWKTGKYTQYTLAVMFKIPKSTIWRIVTNKSHYDEDYQKWLNISDKAF